MGPAGHDRGELTRTAEEAPAGGTRRGARVLPRLVFLGLVLVAAVGLVVGAGWALGFRANLQTRSVPVPTAAASPDEVVRTYVKAYDDRDFATMEAIYPSGQSAYSRVRAMGRMEDVRITGSRPATADDLAGMSPEPGHEHHLVQVALTYTGLTGSDLAYRPGPNGWTYYLERADDGGTWTIIDHGNG